MPKDALENIAKSSSDKKKIKQIKQNRDSTTQKQGAGLFTFRPEYFRALISQLFKM